MMLIDLEFWSRFQRLLDRTMSIQIIQINIVLESYAHIFLAQGAIDDLDLALELEPRNVVALSSRGDAKRMMQDGLGEFGC